MSGSEEGKGSRRRGREENMRRNLEKPMKPLRPIVAKHRIYRVKATSGFFSCHH